MGADSKISWTHHTFNIVTGCTKVSEACKYCYAEAFSKRIGLDVWGQDKPRKIWTPDYWLKPLKWNRAAAKAGERHRVFCSSMADVFEDHADVELARQWLWPLIEMTPHLDWLLLTKRPENIMRMVPKHWRAEFPRNVWAGCTAENQERADERIPHLLEVPAAVRFVSCEPILGPISLWAFIKTPLRDQSLAALGASPMPGISWAISGCESGARPRPSDLNWVRALRDECVPAGVAFHHKQWTVSRDVVQLPELDGRQWAEFPQVRP